MAPTRRSGKRKREREREREKERKKERLVFYSSYTVCVCPLFTTLSLLITVLCWGKRGKGRRFLPLNYFFHSRRLWTVKGCGRAHVRDEREERGVRLVSSSSSFSFVRFCFTYDSCYHNQHANQVSPKVRHFHHAFALSLSLSLSLVFL